MILCERRGQFIFQVRPDIFPEGYLTDTEIELWDLLETAREDAKNSGG